MSARHLFLLSPYRPPTSYPVTLAAGEAAAWLNAYAALWHPHALRGAVLPPLAASGYDHTTPVEGAIYALPVGPSVYLEEDWRARAESAGAAAFDATADRAATFAAMMAALKVADDFDPPIVRLFMGVGFGYLMLDTLFDASSHDRLLDVEAFWKDVQAAVEAAFAKNDGEVRTLLARAAEMLKTAREGLSPNGVSLVDLIVLGDESWPCPFTSARPVTLIATSQALKTLAEKKPEQFQQLKAAIPTDLPSSVDLAIGVALERDDALLPLESQLWNLRQAHADVYSLLGVHAKLYARTQSQYHPLLPSWLNQAGFTGVLALNFDGATMPSRYSSVVQWPGPDGKAVNAFTRDPLPAHEASTFFNFAHHLHDSTSRDSNPVVAIAHTKPPAVGYEDLLALSELADVFGTWQGLDRLTADSHTAEYVAVTSADEFFTDTLDDRASRRNLANPLSGFAEQARGRRRLDHAFALAALHRSLIPPSESDLELQAKLEAAESALESGTAADFTLEAAWAAKLAERLLARSEPNRPGWLILNPAGSLRRVGCEIEASSAIPLGGPVKASDFTNGKATVVVEVPGLGYAWIPRGTPGTVLPKSKFKTAEGTTVRNEYLEAEVDPATGAVKAIRDGKARSTRFGQMLVANEGGRMIATSVSVTQCNNVLGEVTSTGTIINASNHTIANFTQRVRTWIGRPALELRIELTPTVPLAGFPWQNYFASRFAWRDDRATLYRGVHGLNAVTGFHRPQSSDYFEVRFGKERSFLFTGGLPFLQRHGGRMIDCLLAVPGEAATTFELLIAFDREFPMPTAQSWLAAAPVVPVEKGPPPTGDSGWLANVDLPSLHLTSLRPAKASEGFNRAVTARFIETSGFACASELRFARDPQQAHVVDLNGDPAVPLAMIGDAVPLDFSANELVSVKCEWK